MDYKKIIKSRSMRSKILRMLRFIPDRPMLELQYYIKMGRRLNLKNPRRYTEKLQWYKLYYRDPLMVQCADKGDVREYVKSKGLGDILTKCYGVYDRVEDIDFESLPNQFVMKDTLGGGGNSVIIVKDKASFDIEAAKAQMQKWVNRPAHIRGGGREWPYYSGKNHRIIIEEYLNQKNDDLADYKFFSFNGKSEFLYYIKDRNLGDHGALAVLNRDFERLDVQSLTQNVLNENPDKPVNYHKMVEIADLLSKDFPHVRVDLYNLQGKIYFGELTFYGASGYQKFAPDEFDFEMGNVFILPEKM